MSWHGVEPTTGQAADRVRIAADVVEPEGHVLGFKGLERPAVVLAVNGMRDESRAKEMLYVGLSRARSQLIVCGDLDSIGRLAGPAVRRRLEQASPL